MQFKRVNRDAPERVFIVMRANETGIAADDVVQLELTAASVDGILVVQPNTGELPAVIGVADAAIANGSYGLVQVYGYRSTSRIGSTATSQAIGVALLPVAGQDYFSSVASTAGILPMAVLLETITTSVSSDTFSRKIWLHMM